MIKILRPSSVSARLQQNGSRQTRLDSAAYDAAPIEFRSGKKFPDRDYYRSPDVKDTLYKAQHSKCCYCEKLLESPDLQVEHFRPKGAYRQSADEPYGYPGYYWLAYDWNNLLLACPTCNKNKDATFPLSNPDQRAISHHDDLSIESALLIDPAAIDPRDHIGFVDDAPRYLSDRGRCTVAVLGLCRDQLTELRLKRLRRIRQYWSIYRGGPPYDQEAIVFLRDAIREDAQFSSMAMDFLASVGLLAEISKQTGD